MIDDDDFDYEYDPLFDVSSQCSCEDPVEDESHIKEYHKSPGQSNSASQTTGNGGTGQPA